MGFSGLLLRTAETPRASYCVHGTSLDGVATRVVCGGHNFPRILYPEGNLIPMSAHTKRLLYVPSVVLSGAGYLFLLLVGVTVVLLVHTLWALYTGSPPLPYALSITAFLWIIFFFRGIRRRGVGCQTEPRRAAL